jgi:uncharacterized membrane protein YkvA (DUF1232 family)
MSPTEQHEYRDRLSRSIAGWAVHARGRGDPWWDAVERVPDYFDALVALSRHPALAPRHRRVVRRTIKYLISPLDLRSELIYGPDGFREDLALLAMTCDWLVRELGPAVLEGTALAPDDPGLAGVRERMGADLTEDERRHLELLLTADAIAGDEDLAREDLAAADLTASAARPAPPLPRARDRVRRPGHGQDLPH